MQILQQRRQPQSLANFGAFSGIFVNLNPIQKLQDARDKW
jgi:hypothetical protein